MGFWGDPYLKLGQDLKAIFRPQREWIEGRGLLLILGHFFSGIGAGTWAFSILFRSEVGLWLGLLLVGVGGGGAHLAFLGQPSRFWRILVRPQSSWISRGLWGIGLLLISGLLYLSPLPGERVWLGLSLLGTLVIFIYKGFVYAFSKAIPFWHSPLLPLLYFAYALRGGVAVLLVATPWSLQGLDRELLELIKLWVVTSTAMLLLSYLVLMSQGGGAAQRSVADLLGGRVSLAFYLGVVLLGLAIPLALGLWGFLATLSLFALAFVGIASLVGDFYFKYAIAKAGIYTPLFPQGPRR